MTSEISLLPNCQGRTTDSFLNIGIPPLNSLPDLLSWRSIHFAPLAWRNAFDAYLEKRAGVVFRHSDLDGCLAQSLTMLPENKRRRFLRTPSVAMLLRRHISNQFDAQLFAELVLTELATAGIATELPRSMWTARGDRFLNLSTPECWTFPEVNLGDTDIAIDTASSIQFPDDEFGLPATVPYDGEELEMVIHRILTAVSALHQACAPGLELVTTTTEVLALRREPAKATSFYSSTFPSCMGLVRFANAHLSDVDTAALIEALVHEAIHCILHIHEEIEEPFVRAVEANHIKVVSPWTGATIRLQSYIHACIVWYGVYWLWSMEGFASEDTNRRVEILRQRAQHGFQCRPISIGLVPFSHLLTESIKGLLREVEERMLAIV